jgi:hypothetical protein
MTSIATGIATGDDIESALEIIEANGGSGEWEESENNAGQIPRWLFPRFEGADKFGTCSDANGDVPDGHEGNHDQTGDCGENFAPDMGNMYLSRTGTTGYDTDVETVCGWLSAPRNVVGGVMLLGEPGGGKTALAQAAATHGDWEFHPLTATPDHTKDDLMRRFVGEGKGIDGTAFEYGPLAQAVIDAQTKRVVLGIDEFWLYVDGVKPLFYSLLDGGHWLPEAGIDGSALAIPPTLRVIITANPQVRGASLPEPIGSRFAGSTLTIETSAAMLRDLAIDESVVAAWEALGTAGLWRPQIREMRVADYWLQQNPAQSVSAFLGEHCPESQREQIRNTVVSYLGGQIRNDGRLVVS